MNFFSKIDFVTICLTNSCTYLSVTFNIGTALVGQNIIAPDD